MIEVVLPTPLYRLAKISGPVLVELKGEVTQRALLGEVESRYPMLRGTMRDPHSGRRRAYVRFFACKRDLSDASPDEPLPAAVVSGEEPFLVVGALSGG
ncbi:MoaD/ThiS family protein [Haliea sp. E17]|uniref:MoaD/ThiS family protein n=1 Tax=Haliea sp. E17 TaxID=3401576 RepID=UPI003AAE6D25